jgi:hypothetical protein
VSSPAALQRAVSEFAITGPDLVIEPAARAAAHRSLAQSGLLLLGEMHGVRENPLLIRALMQAFGLASLALEWPKELGPVIGGFLAGQGLPHEGQPGSDLADLWELWSGDGRITAGHMAVLAERTAAGPLELILFDGPVDADWTWSRRDEAMARRVLSASPAGTCTLVVAGNGHTVTHDTELGTPMGAYLARERPGVTEIRISYDGGSFYNFGPRPFGDEVNEPPRSGDEVNEPPRSGDEVNEPRRSGGEWNEPRRVTLAQRDGALVLDLPWATEAVVPHRPRPAWFRSATTD